jgi:hypothetical protein
MNCPICGAEAINATPGNFDGLIVECKHCGAYEIPDDALNSLIRLDFDARRSALEKARAAVPTGERPSIARAYL